jgi:lipopolysaccharide assembly protein A
MRWVYLIIVVLFVAAVALFAAQNLGAVTTSFLGFSVRGPLAILTVIVDILGAVTGGSLFALLRKSVQGSRARPVG